MKMEKKEIREMTFQEFFHTMKQQLLAPLKQRGFTEKQVNEMKMEKVFKELEDITKQYTMLLDATLQKVRKERKEEPPTRPIKPVDLKNMFKEISIVREKYGIPKGIFLVPDKLEISVQRISYDNFHLSYKEFFNYLPNHILDVVLLTTTNFLVQAGIPREQITRIGENGVGLEVDVNFFYMASCILSELLIQKRFEDGEFSSLLKYVEENRKMFADVSESEYEWNSEIENKFYSNLSDLSRIMQENPSVRVELEAIVKKYTQRSEIKESEDKRSNLESEK